MGTLLYGPASEPYNTYDPVSPAPGDNGSGGQIAQRGVQALGQQLILADGRKYRFTRCGATALVVGFVQQSAAIISTDQSMTCAAQAIGDRIVTFTHGGATSVINYFAEGYAVISLDPGEGQCFKIASHAALRNATAGDVVNLAPGNAVQIALTTTSDLSLMAHAYDGVVLCAATITGLPVGVALTTIPIGDFGWLQTRGAASVTCTGTMTKGSPAVMLLSGGTAGTPAPSSASTQPEVGKVQMVEATGDASGLFLTMDG